MNAIAEDFLKEIESKAGFPQSELLREKLTETLAGKVERFIEWLILGQTDFGDPSRNFDHELVYGKFIEGYGYEDKDYTISDLFEFWLTNVDNK